MLLLQFREGLAVFLLRTVDLKGPLLWGLTFYARACSLFRNFEGSGGQTASDMLELPEGATIADLLKHYEGRIPRLKDSLPCWLAAVNQEYARADNRAETRR